MTTFILDILAIGAIFSSVLIITTSNPVVSVLYLIAVFVLSACYLIMLGVSFIGLSYLIVYVGAVAVLFLFVIMMLNVRVSEIVSIGQEYTKNLPLGYLVSILFLFELFSVIPTVSSQASEFILNLVSWANSLMLNIDSVPTDVHLTFINNSADVIYDVMSQTQTLGFSMYTYNSFWLIITSIILLLAIIGPIALCMRTSQSHLYFSFSLNLIYTSLSHLYYLVLVPWKIINS